MSVVIDNKPRMVTLHKLVWIYFNDNYPEGYDICHKDDDPFNCHLENLEVKTHIENIRDKKVFGNKWYNKRTIIESEKNIYED